MFEAITGALLLIAALTAIAVMVIMGVDTALRESYKKHAMRLAREQYRKWCAETPVEVESRLVVICGKGYNTK